MTEVSELYRPSGIKGTVFSRMFQCGVAVLVFVAVSEKSAAVEPFGFRFGMSQKAVEGAVDQRGIGPPSWLGRTLRVQAVDSPHILYMFNFCGNELVEISGHFPQDFDQMANVVDESVKTYGQPWLVSAQGGMTDSGFLRPINLYWKIDKKTFMRLMEMPNSYTLVYETENACWKVPR
jgi:hypothetical protein